MIKKYENDLGILNYYSKSSNFFDEYVEVGFWGAFTYPATDVMEESPYRLILVNKAKDGAERSCLDVPIGLLSFLGVSVYLTGSEEQLKIQPAQSSVVSLTRYFGVEMVLSFVDCVQEQKITRNVSNLIYRSHLLSEKDDGFFCMDIRLSDAVCYYLISEIPLYVNKEIFDNHGMSESYILDRYGTTGEVDEL